MANANSQQALINFSETELNCSEYKDSIVNFKGFNYRNSPFLSGEVKPIYTKEYSADGWVDEDLNEYKIENGYFKKNEVNKASFTTGIEVNEATYRGDFIDYCPELNCILSIKDNYVYIQDTDGTIRYSKQTYDYDLIKGFLRVAAKTNVGNDIFVVLYFRDSDNENIYELLLSINQDYEYKDEWLILVPRTAEDISFFYAGQVNGKNRYVSLPISIIDSIYQLDIGNGFRYIDIDLVDSNHEFVHINGIDIYDNSDYTPVSSAVIAFDKMMSYVAGASFDLTVPSGSNQTVYEIYDYNNIRQVDNAWRLSYKKYNTTGVPDNYDSPKMITNDSAKYSNRLNYNNAKVFYDKLYVAIVIGKATIDTFDVYLTMVIPRSNPQNSYFVEYNNIVNKQKLPPLRINSANKLNLLVNNEMNANISISDTSSVRGSILFPYYEIDDYFLQSSPKHSFYGGIKINGRIYYIKDGEVSFSVFNDRYLIFNVSNFYNCYDIKEDTFIHFADDFNSRFGKYDINNSVHYSSTVTDAMQRGWLISSVNTFFQANNTISISAQFNPYCTIYRLMTYGEYQYIPIDQINIEVNPSYILFGNIKYYGVDCFWNNDITDSIPEYVRTVIKTSAYTNFIYNFTSDDDYTVEEGNQLLNLPLIVKIDTTDLLCFATVDDWFSAPIVRIGTKDYPVYYLLSAQEDFDIFFVIQTTAYGIKDGYIYSLDFENGILQNISRVASCKGLKFIASTPLSALFWANQNQTIYSFKGSCLMEQGKTLDEVSDIIQAKYNPETTEVFLCTNKYVLVSAVNYTYKIPVEATDIFFSKKGFCLRYTTTSDGVTTKHLNVYTYNEDFWTDYSVTRMDINIETGYYGVGSNCLTTIDCVYVRIYDNLKRNLIPTQYPAFFKIKASCICADGTIKETNLRTFDEYPTSSNANRLYFDDHHTAYIRWQPNIQNAVGMKIIIETNCCITYMDIGYQYNGKEITVR